MLIPQLWCSAEPESLKQVDRAMHTDKDYEEVLSPNLYFDKNFEIEAVKILPGEYYVTTRDMALVTVLGSCVAASRWWKA